MHAFTIAVGSTDGRTFSTEGKGEKIDDHFRGPKASPCACVTEAHERPARRIFLLIVRPAVEAGLLLWFLRQGDSDTSKPRRRSTSKLQGPRVAFSRYVCGGA